MLVVRRRAGEAILLGGEIEHRVRIGDLMRTRVKLGIRALNETRHRPCAENLSCLRSRIKALPLCWPAGPETVEDLLRLLRQCERQNHSNKFAGGHDM